MHDSALGDYQVIRQIGEGTLGSIVLAEHRFLKRKYILKILAKELCQDRAFLRRFEEEVARLAKLDHPHIVKIHNVSCADETYFVVTEFCATMNLAQYVSETSQPLEEEVVFSILYQVASALDYAHGQGVIHGSLKLSNVLIGPEKPETDIFISECGLANIVSPWYSLMRIHRGMVQMLDQLPDKEEKTHPFYNPFLQSFAFLAPEQKTYMNLTEQVDTYAFGVLMYALIAGHYPEGIFEMPSKVRPEYQYDWDVLVVQCLRQDPALRPVHLVDLLQARVKKHTLHVTAPRILSGENDSEARTSIDELKVKLVHATQEVKTVAVETKDVSEATAIPMTPASDENYAHALHAMLNRDPIVTHYNPEKNESKCLDPIYSEMVVIQGGEFFRGSNEGNRDEAPAHRVYLDTFKIDIHPVTNEQFVRFLEHMGGEKDQNYNDLIRLKDSRISRSAGRVAIESGYSRHPVVGVTWYGAVAYAKWVGRRLPTEAEWEIAARGGLEHAPYSTGDTIEKHQANFFSSDTTAMMSYPANGYGLYDMLGNVYEWCHDWYSYNYYEISAQEPHNPKGPLQGVYRVLRGGCWKSLKEDLRVSHRHRNNPGTVNSTCGFRCASDVK